MLLDSGLESRMSTSGRPDPRQVALVVGGIFGGAALIALIILLITHL